MNDFDWTSQLPPSDEAWTNYFNLLLSSIDDIVSEEFNGFYSNMPMYDDPKDFVNGFTLAGAFFQGLHLETNPEVRKSQIASFRRSLSIFIMHLLYRLEHDER